MVCDEVMAGFGRTGEWFAVNHWNVVPDIITMAKGLTSAYVPMGAVGMRQPIADHFRDKVFQGGLTYNSHPLGCAAALATLRVYEEDDLDRQRAAARAGHGGAARRARAEAPDRRRAPHHRSVRHRRAGQGPRDEGAAGAVRRTSAATKRLTALLPRGGALHVRAVAHVLHEPAAVRHRGAAARGVRDDRSRADAAGGGNK